MFKKKKKIEIEPWRTDIVNRYSISKDSMALMIEQSSKMLNETVETAKTIQGRADRLIAILLPTFSGLLVYLSNINYSNKLSFLQICGIVAFIEILLSVFFCYLNLKEYTIKTIGAEPQFIMEPQFIDNFIEKEYICRQYISIGIALCERMQLQILENEATNTKRMRNNRNALRLLSFTPIVSPLVAWIALYLS